MGSFVPEHFRPPRRAMWANGVLEALGPGHAAQDFAALQSSEIQVRKAFGARHWWSADITFEQNQADLAKHEAEFQARTGFAYAMRGPSGAAYLGCVYLLPIKPAWASLRERFDARAYFWLSALQRDLDDTRALAGLRAWLASDWPFQAVVFPGRSMAWPEWDTLAP